MSLDLHQHLDDGVWHLDDSEYPGTLTTEIDDRGDTMTIIITNDLDEGVMDKEVPCTIYGWPRGRLSTYIDDQLIDGGKGFGGLIEITLIGGKTTRLEFSQDPVPPAPRPRPKPAPIPVVDAQQKLDELKAMIATLERDIQS